MSTVRIQVRRGLSTEWASVNPILAAGEMGLESDTNFIKFGNGTDHWADLAYANDPTSFDLNNTLSDYVLISEVGHPGGPAGPLTVAGKIPSDQLDITELSQDAVNDAIVAGDGLKKTYNDSANTITVDVELATSGGLLVDNDGKLATDSSVVTLNSAQQTLTNKTIDTASNDITVVAADVTDFAEAALDAVGPAFDPDSTLNFSYNDAANTIEASVDTSVIATKSWASTELGLKADVDSPTFTGIPHAPNPSTGSNGTQIATTSFVQALVSDIVDGAPTALNTLNEIALALQGDEDTLGALITTVDGKQEKVANISSSEIGMLDGVTSNIQDQLDDKLASSTAASTYATIDNPTFTGTLNLPLGSINSTMIENGTIIDSDINEAAEIDPAKIAGHAITLSDNGTITHTMIAEGTIENVNISETAGIAKTKIDGVAITAADAGTVTSTMIANSTIVNGDISDTAEIDKTKIAGVAITAVDTGTVVAAMLSPNAVETAKINNSAVTTAKIADANVTAGKLASDAVETVKIKDGAVVNSKLASDAVETINIKDANVTNAKLATNSVDSAQIVEAAVTAGKIAANAVDTAEIKDDAVTAGKIAADAVDTAEIKDGAVTSNKIANGTIVNADISDTAAIDQSKISGLTTDLGAKASSSDLNTHSSSTTTVHGIADTAALATMTYADDAADSAVSGHNLDTTNVHGIADTSLLATKAYADQAESDAIDAAAVASENYTDAAVAALTKSSVGLGNVDNTSDANKPVSTATQTALDLKAPKASPTFTGTLTAADVEITGNLNVTGTTTTVDSQNLAVTDSLIYLAKNQYSADVLDIGIYGAYGTSGNNGANHPHTGLIRDASDGKWKLISGGAEPTDSEVNFATATKDTLVIGALDATSATIGNVSNTELQYLDGVTSAIQTQINAKAPIAAPTFTGLVTVSSSGVAFSDKTQTAAGVPSRTPIATTISSSTTLASGLQDNMVPLSGAVTITIGDTSNAAYAIGESIDFFQSSGTGATFAKTGSVNLLYTPGLALRTTYSSATAQKITSTDWLIYGDLKA